MDKNSKIYVAGHRGLVGTAFIRLLKDRGYHSLILRTHDELDLTCQNSVRNFFEKEQPEYVILAAAKVGGIQANNQYRADFLYQNLMIQNNVVEASYRCRVKKLLFLGSSCIYPRNAAQPIPETALLQAALEYTNEPYAIAKIAGMKLCESYNLQYGCNFISVMPTNLYGPHDSFDLHNSHVLPALIRKIHLAALLQKRQYPLLLHDLGQHNKDAALALLKKHGISEHHVEIWGSGTPKRDLLYSLDMVEACLHIMEHVDFSDTYEEGTKEIRNTHINVGSGKEYRISDLAEMIKKIVGYTGDFVYNTEKPDGTPRKQVDISKLLQLGWRPRTDLEDGIRTTYRWYSEQSQHTLQE